MEASSTANTSAESEARTSLREPALRVLVADDCASTRLLLTGLLKGWGHEVVTACDGDEAWVLLEAEDIPLIVTDWVMPGLSGPELCRRIRERRSGAYSYVIVLTQRTDEEARVEGLRSGADDYLGKPFHGEELRARIEAGARVIRLERGLARRNELLAKANEELAAARARIETDLVAAARVQRSLLPTTPRLVHGWKVASLFSPSTWVSGDLFNFFPIDDRRLAFYHLDVAGHGVAAALLSAALSRDISPATVRARSQGLLEYPAAFVRSLNDAHPCDDNGAHFTIVYGVLDSLTGCGSLVQAGHPHPVLSSRHEPARIIGEGGPPVGLLPGLDYHEVAIALEPGDRLLLCSDGVTDCSSPEGMPWGEKRLLEVVDELRDRPLAELTAEIGARLRAWRGHDEIEDDISLLALEAPSGRGEEGEGR